MPLRNFPQDKTVPLIETWGSRYSRCHINKPQSWLTVNQATKSRVGSAYKAYEIRVGKVAGTAHPTKNGCKSGLFKV
jgi:hypothetical protein